MDGYQCTTCYKTFGRQEHLKRHEQSHRAAQFHCSKCSKPFRRSDALKKHQQNHLTNDMSLLRRGARACSSCASSKSRCTGESPCARCSAKKLQCVYPTKRRRSAKDSSGPIPDQDPNVSSTASSPQPLSATEDAAFEPAGTLSTRHDLDSNTPLPIQHPSQLDTVNPYDSQPLSSGQNGVFYPPVGQHATIATPDFAMNMMSTINWLQMDASSFQSDHLHNPFAFPPQEFSASPSIGFAGLINDNDLRILENGSLLNVFDQQQSPQLVDNTTDCQPAPAVLNPYISNDGTLQYQPVSPTTGSSVPTNEATVASGEYYVDGDAGRLPKSKRRKLATGFRHHLKPMKEVDFSLKFLYPLMTTPEPRLVLSSEIYEQICDLYNKLCLETSVFKAFQPSEFPSKSTFEGLLSHYFSNFDQTLPFLHFPTFKADSCHGALLLAMMALGSCYIDCGETETFSLSMHEFVRRYLVLRKEQRQWPPEDSKTIAQIHLLHAIGAGFTLYDPLYESASRSLYSATKFCKDEWVSLVHGNNSRLRNLSSDWTLWIRREEILRIGFCIWLVDCMWAFYFHQTPHLCLDLATAMNLPCTEELWSVNNISDWTRLTASKSPDTPTFLETLQNLYIDKRLLSNLGEFSRILLIHGLIRRTWEIKTTVTQSLSTFEPSAQKQASRDIQPGTSIWPPSVPLFNKWRNSACDCLDILHWSANATVGAASGIEHPTVLHLHLARVILLGPMKELVQFTHHLIRPTSKDLYRIFPPTTSTTTAEEHRRLILRWAVQDQYKARLAAIHAGVIFWHVRMYTINGFYEPTAVAFAALLLWALGTFASTKPHHAREQNPQRQGSSGSPVASSSAPQDYCDIILIDRPTDDELVQHFVRQGHGMHVNITGVGNLFGPEGPRKVLAEGQRLLKTLTHWRGVTAYWLRVLNQLENVIATIGVDLNTAEASTRVE